MIRDRYYIPSKELSLCRLKLYSVNGQKKQFDKRLYMKEVTKCEEDVGRLSVDLCQGSYLAAKRRGSFRKELCPGEG